MKLMGSCTRAPEEIVARLILMGISVCFSYTFTYLFCCFYESIKIFKLILHAIDDRDTVVFVEVADSQHCSEMYLGLRVA